MHLKVVPQISGGSITRMASNEDTFTCLYSLTRGAAFEPNVLFNEPEFAGPCTCMQGSIIVLASKSALVRPAAHPCEEFAVMLAILQPAGKRNAPFQGSQGANPAPAAYFPIISEAPPNLELCRQSRMLVVEVVLLHQALLSQEPGKDLESRQRPQL